MMQAHFARCQNLPKNNSDFICIYEEIAGGQDSAPDPVVTAVCLCV